MSTERGGALLAVLWLSAALSAIAFAIATNVEGETERAHTSLESARAYYLATGAIDRALLWIFWGMQQYRNPDGSVRYYEPGLARMPFDFPSGVAVVEVIPETAKLSLNRSGPAEIQSLLTILGVPAERAMEITASILDWRTPAGPDGISPLDQFYLSLTPSFRARHASFEETEELLLAKGMTPDVFYGRYERDAEGRMIARGGLRDCISPYGSTDQYDINTVHPAVMATLGMTPQEIQMVEQARNLAPIRRPEQLQAVKEAGGPGMQRLRIGGNSIFTLRATARMKLPNGGLSDLRRSVAATIKFLPAEYSPPYQVMRWYDNAFSDRNPF